MQNSDSSPLISIISPVYNAELYIDQCVESIINQSYQKWELILVDDGSTDNSSIICDNWSKKDSRITVIHKSNGGVGSARQIGIEHAKGEYSIHVDPDDWIEEDMLKIMVTEAIKTGAEMVICDYYRDFQSESIIIGQRPKSITPDGVSFGLFQQLHGSCCNKLISSTCYSKESFVNGINLSEDLLYICKVLQHVKIVAYVPKALYHYVYHEMPSQSTIYNRDRFYQLKFVYEQLSDIYKEDPIIGPLANKKRLERLAIVGAQTIDLSGKELFNTVGFTAIPIVFRSKVSFIRKVLTTVAILNLKFVTDRLFKVKK